MSHLEKEPNPNLSDQAPATGATAIQATAIQAPATGATAMGRVVRSVGALKSTGATAIQATAIQAPATGATAMGRVVRSVGALKSIGTNSALAPALAGGMDLNVGGTAVGLTMSNSPILMTTSQSAVTSQPLTQEQFQQLRQEYQEILDIKDRQLQIKEETIGACRQEIDYLRSMVDELLKQPTLAELVGVADQIKANLQQSQTPMNP